MWSDLKFSGKLDVTSRECTEYKEQNQVSNSPWDIKLNEKVNYKECVCVCVCVCVCMHAHMRTSIPIDMVLSSSFPIIKIMFSDF